MDETTHELLDKYVRELFAQEDETLKAIRPLSAEHGLPQIHIRPEEGRMLQFLLTAIGARCVVEIGALAGYSGVWIVRALPPDGRLITLEVDERHAAFARQVFDWAGLGERVEVRLGHAPSNLPELAAEGPFDAVFIDADKVGYPEYLAWAVENVRVGGLVMGHNAFSRGRVVDSNEQGAGVQGLRAFNRQLAEDPRLLGTIIPVGDGIAVAVRAS